MHQIIIFVLKSKQIQGVDKIHRSVPVICCFAEASRYLDARKYLIGSERETHYDQVKRKWAETRRSLAGGYLQLENQSVLSAEDVYEPSCRKRLRKLRQTILRKVFLLGEETGVKGNPGDVVTRVKGLRDSNVQKRSRKEE